VVVVAENKALTTKGSWFFGCWWWLRQLVEWLLGRWAREGEMRRRRKDWRRRRGSELVKLLCTARTLLYIHYFKS
jgi:hypothetical protein